MDQNKIQKPKSRKIIILLLKIAITIVCIWYVFRKIDLFQVSTVLKQVNWLYLPLALISFVISKLISSIRLNFYFRNINIHLSQWENLKLYWLGMFYNLFLPGAISGDAYKVILLKKKKDVSYKKISAAVILDRLSGLLGMGLILAFYAVKVIDNNLYIGLIISGSISAVIILYLVIILHFKDFISSFNRTLLLGFFVQIFQVVCIYLVMAALEISTNESGYIFIFLVSSIVSVLPITIGGLGIRELVFLKGSIYFGLQQETSVLISILFYLITLLTSAAGLYFVFKDPLKQKIMDSNLSP